MSVVLWVSGQVDTRSEILWHCMEVGDTVLLSWCMSPVPLPVSPTLYAVYLGTACCRIHTVSLPVSMYGTTSGTLLLVLRSGGPEVSVGQQLATTPHLYLSTSTQLGCTPYLVPGAAAVPYRIPVWYCYSHTSYWSIQWYCLTTGSLLVTPQI